jgi:hypothetical protein
MGAAITAGSRAPAAVQYLPVSKRFGDTATAAVAVVAVISAATAVRGWTPVAVWSRDVVSNLAVAWNPAAAWKAVPIAACPMGYRWGGTDLSNLNNRMGIRLSNTIRQWNRRESSCRETDAPQLDRSCDVDNITVDIAAATVADSSLV